MFKTFAACLTWATTVVAVPAHIVSIETVTASQCSGVFDPFEGELYYWIIDRTTGKTLYEGVPGRSHPDFWFVYPAIPQGTQARFVVRNTVGDLSVTDTYDKDF